MVSGSSTPSSARSSQRRGRPLLRHLASRLSSGRELAIVGASCRGQLLDREVLGVALAHAPRHAREQSVR
jgi:hypothetical protein